LADTSISLSDRIRNLKEKKSFVIDTNVILHDPYSVFGFGENEVVIPIRVIEEADSFKREMNEKGKNARAFSRLLDAMRKYGNLADGVPLQVAAAELFPTSKHYHGGSLRVFVREVDPNIRKLVDGASSRGDNSILAVCMELIKEKRHVILVTKDVSFRVRADAFGVPCEDYQPDSTISIDELDPGWKELLVSSQDLESFYRRKELELKELVDAYPNQYFVLKDSANEKNTALAKWDHEGRRAIPIIEMPKGLWGVAPRNREQRFAIDALLNDKIPLVTLVGKAGTGKTMLALAAGLTKVLEESAYTKMLVSRSIFPLGKDIGYLPGEMEEKLRPWMQPIFDNFEFLLSSKGARDRRISYKTIMEFGQVEIEALTYIRGRTIPNQWMVVDEAQNLTPHEIKTIITRVGEGTKIVLTGDPFQIDNPYLDASNNAVTYVAERFMGSPVGAHIVMLKGERSALADVASNVL
jgi:PhoH-like ATPase